MGILDGIPLCLARAVAGSPATPTPSAPLLCLFFSAQWCPGTIQQQHRYYVLGTENTYEPLVLVAVATAVAAPAVEKDTSTCGCFKCVFPFCPFSTYKGYECFSLFYVELARPPSGVAPTGRYDTRSWHARTPTPPPYVRCTFAFSLDAGCQIAWHGPHTAHPNRTTFLPYRVPRITPYCIELNTPVLHTRIGAELHAADCSCCIPATHRLWAAPFPHSRLPTDN